MVVLAPAGVGQLGAQAARGRGPGLNLGQVWASHLPRSLSKAVLVQAGSRCSGSSPVNDAGCT
jgi:hypothetical protein